MTETHVVSALVAKRAELTGSIEHFQAQIRQTSVERDHLDATLLLPLTALVKIAMAIRWSFNDSLWKAKIVPDVTEMVCLQSRQRHCRRVLMNRWRA